MSCFSHTTWGDPTIKHACWCHTGLNRRFIKKVFKTRFYILFNGLSKITLAVPFLMFHINFGYLFPAMTYFVDKIILINRINRIHCKCLEQINTFLCHLSRSDWC